MAGRLGQWAMYRAAQPVCGGLLDGHLIGDAGGVEAFPDAAGDILHALGVELFIHSPAPQVGCLSSHFSGKFFENLIRWN